MPTLNKQATITNTPRNPILGLLADAIQPVANSGLLGEFLLGKSGKVLDDMSYGYSPTTGRGMTTGVKPDAVDLLNLTPLAGVAKPLAKIAGREIARQVQTGTGLVGRNVIDPRQNIFIGERAKTFDVEKAKKYKELRSKGVSDRDAYMQTGTFEGADKKLRQEIDDSQFIYNDPEALQAMAKQRQDKIAELKQIVKPNRVQPDLFPKSLTEARKPYKQEIENLTQDLNSNFGLLADPKYTGQLNKFVVDHPELYNAYPDLAEYTTRQGMRDQEGLLGSYDSNRTFDVTALGLSRENNPRSTMIHEIQHAVQQTENFGRGGMPDTFAREAEEAQAEIRTILRSLVELSKMKERAISAGGIDPETGIGLNSMDLSLDELKARRAELLPIAMQDPYKSYRNLAGEVESRLTQERLGMTMPERLASYPPDMMLNMGHPIQEQLVRGLLEK